jgi:hypothetical protein
MNFTFEDGRVVTIYSSIKLKGTLRDEPAHADHIMEQLLKNRTEADLIFDLYFSVHLGEILTTAPAYADRIIEKILGDTKIFNRVIRSGNSLANTLLACPAYADRIMEQVLRNPIGLNPVFDLHFSTHLDKILAAAPAYADRLIEKILRDAEIFSCITMSAEFLCNTLKAFPTHIDRIMQTVLESPEILRRVFSSRDSLLDVLGSAPSYTDRIMKVLLGNPNHIPPVFGREKDLQAFAKNFPHLTAIQNTTLSKLLTNARIQQSKKMTLFQRAGLSVENHLKTGQLLYRGDKVINFDGNLRNPDNKEILHRELYQSLFNKFGLFRTSVLKVTPVINPAMSLFGRAELRVKDYLAAGILMYRNSRVRKLEEILPRDLYKRLGICRQPQIQAALEMASSQSSVAAPNVA